MTVKPFTPDEALGAHVSSIPDEVIEEVNRLLARDASTAQAHIRIKQDELVAALMARGLSKDDLFNKKWLDFEPLFREQGWRVDYDKPGYNESYGAFWIFRRAQ